MKFGTTVLAFLLSVAAQAANIDIQWAIQEYEDTTAAVGDTITFTWASGHNVYIHPSGNCDAEGAILVGETPPATYTFTAEDVDEDLFFVCGVAGHCDAGQTITVSVAAADASAGTESLTPSSVPLASGSASPSAVVPGGESSSAAPSALVAAGSDTPAPTPLATASASAAPSILSSDTSLPVTPAPTVLEFGNETDVPTAAPMDDATIPSVGPSAVGGAATEAPTATTPAANDSSATKASMAGLASATLTMALAWLIE